MSKRLFDTTDSSDPRHQEYWDNYIYFQNRALDYVTEFDPSIGFFQARTSSGAFLLTPAQWNPAAWGNGGSGSTMFTETDPWNMTFTVPQDGNGLANLYGGKAGLAAKLDQFFATPELATGLGSYGVIHETTEASAVQMGQLGLSNQPSYHIPYMYLFAGQPWKTQAVVREAESRLFIGSEIGQGFPGDEDNGATAGWQVMTALGIYPLEMGNDNFVIGSPLFKKATVHLESGHDLVINAPNNSKTNVYVQGVKLNGADYSKTWIPTSVLSAGATLDFDMGPAPSTWGSGPDDAPPSITQGTTQARPLHDATGTGKGTATAIDATVATNLWDNNSSNRVTFNSQTPWMQYQFSGPAVKATVYTLTSGNAAGDPTAWVLRGSNDGTNWTDLDTRSGQSFVWRLYTRAFTVANPGSYAYYRLDVTQNSGEATTGLAEIELLANTATATMLTADFDPTQYNQPVTFTATVTPDVAVPGGDVPAIGTPTGNIQFSIDGSPAGSPVALDAAGKAVLGPISSLAIGTHTVTAAYSGEGYFEPSSASLNHAVKKRLATTTAVTSDINPSIYGQSVTYTATITPENLSSSLPVTGHVQFFVDGVATGGPQPISAGQASIAFNDLKAGSRGIRAQYLADANYAGSTSPTYTQQVKKATPTGSVTSLPPGPITFGLKPTFTATFVNPVAPIGSLAPATVQFLIDGTLMGAPAPIDAAGTATFTPTWNLPAGTHTIKAKYLGNGNFLAVLSAGYTLKINP